MNRLLSLSTQQKGLLAAGVTTVLLIVAVILWYFLSPKPTPKEMDVVIIPTFPTVPVVPTVPTVPVESVEDSEEVEAVAEVILPANYNCYLNSSGKLVGTVGESGRCDAWISECGNGGGCGHTAPAVSEPVTAPPPAATLYECVSKTTGKVIGTVGQQGMCDAWISECGNGGGCTHPVAASPPMYECVSKATGKVIGTVGQSGMCDAWISECGNGGGCRHPVYGCALKSTGAVKGTVSDPTMCDAWISDCGNGGGCNAVKECVGVGCTNTNQKSWGCALKSTGKFVSEISDPAMCDAWLSECGNGGGCVTV